MSDHVQQVGRLLADARGNSDSDVALLEEAARIADIHSDVSLGLKVRIKLIGAANWSGNYEPVVVAFTWCLAQLDRDEQVRLKWERRVLWYYKWVIQSLSNYAQVSRQQIERSFADMSDRFQRAGYGLGAVHQCRAYASIRLGDMDVHREARSKWMASPRDGISDCAACQTHAAVQFDLEEGDLERAMRTAEPIILGRQKCTEVPCVTFGELLLPALKLGSAELAGVLHLSSIRQALSSRDFLSSVGEHCAYLAITGKFGKAIETFETGMSGAMIVKRAWERMIFLQNAVVLFEQLAKRQREAISIKVPKGAPFYRNDDTYMPADVAMALQRMHDEITAEFNQRNGNTYMDQRYQRFRGLAAAISSHEAEDA